MLQTLLASLPHNWLSPSWFSNHIQNLFSITLNVSHFWPCSKPRIPCQNSKKNKTEGLPRVLEEFVWCSAPRRWSFGHHAQKTQNAILAPKCSSRSHISLYTHMLWWRHNSRNFEFYSTLGVCYSTLSAITEQTPQFQTPTTWITLQLPLHASQLWYSFSQTPPCVDFGNHILQTLVPVMYTNIYIFKAVSKVHAKHLFQPALFRV